MSAAVVALVALSCGGTTLDASAVPPDFAGIAWSKACVRPLGCAQGVAVVSSTELRMGHGGQVRGLSMEDGRVLWRVDRPLGERLRMDELASAKLDAVVWPDESALFIVSSYELSRLDPRTGALDWVTPLEPDYRAVRAVDGMLMVWNIHETMRFDPTDGRRMWRSDRTLTSGSSSEGVALWAPGRYHPARKHRYELVEPLTGDHIEFYEVRGRLGSVGPFQLVRESRRLRVLDATSLEPRGWIGLEDVHHLVASSDPYGVVVTDDALAVVDARARTMLWSRRLSISRNVFTDNAAVDIRGDHLFIGYQDTVYQLELRSGETIATYRVPGEARRLVVCDKGVLVEAGRFSVGPQAQTVALDVQ